jgi:putative hydrolase of the HAD superfamily
MRAAGLPIDVETAYRKLEQVANERGPDDTRHFDTLLERLGLKWNPGAIAAGAVAYRVTRPIYLTPFPDSVPTLLKLRDAGYKLGVASKGRAVKLWQKLIRLGLERILHAVTVSEETGPEEVTTDTLSGTLKRLGDVKPELLVFAGCDLTNEIAPANAVKMTTLLVGFLFCNIIVVSVTSIGRGVFGNVPVQPQDSLHFLAPRSTTRPANGTATTANQRSDKVQMALLVHFPRSYGVFYPL